MYGTKEQLVTEAFKDKDVLKTIEALVRTPKETSARNIAVDAFGYAFGKEATRIFRERVNFDPDNDLIYMVKVTKLGKERIYEESNIIDKIKNIACYEDYVKFIIGTVNNVYIVLDEFDIEREQPFMKVKIGYTGDKEIDKKISNIIRALSRKTLK